MAVDICVVVRLTEGWWLLKFGPQVKENGITKKLGKEVIGIGPVSTASVLGEIENKDNQGK